MNLLLLTEADRASGDTFRVAGPRARHVAEVLRAEAGRTLRVGLLDGPLGTGRVVRSDADACELECAFDPAPPPRPRVDLLVAVPRPATLRRLLPDVAAMGVRRIVLFRTWRTAKPYLSQALLRPEEHRPLLHEGLMQARCTREPEVVVEPLFKPFVEDRLPSLVAGREGEGRASAFALHPGAARPLAACEFPPPPSRILLAIGPEGGFLPYEVDALTAAGLLPASLGPRILRVETACVAALAVAASRAT